MQKGDTEKNEKIKKEKIDTFLKEIETVCKKHNLSISHEDGHGAFQVEKFDKDNIEWLMNARNITQ